jgi:glycosyltransferase involved in cell wall biosynthesis
MKKHPAIVFAFRYPDNVGFVWKTIFNHRELVAKKLSPNYQCIAAFPEITGSGLYRSDTISFSEIDLYDANYENHNKVIKFIFDNNVKVVVFMSAMPSDLAMNWYVDSNVLTITTENDSFDNRASQGLIKGVAKWLLRSVLKRDIHSLHVANSNTQLEFLARFGKYPRNRLAVNVNGIDVEKFVPADRLTACRSLGLQEDMFWVMSASQARSEKRVDKIIETAADIFSKDPESKLRFMYVGAGHLLEKWKELAKSKSLENRFLFFGQQDNLVPYYQAASVFVHAAERESFGLVIAEALACGCPVIASGAAGPTEILSNSQAGLVVGLDDFQGMQNGIMSYYKNPEMRNQHSQNAVIHAKKNFSIYRQAEEFAEMIKKVISRP